MSRSLYRGILYLFIKQFFFSLHCYIQQIRKFEVLKIVYPKKPNAGRCHSSRISVTKSVMSRFHQIAASLSVVLIMESIQIDQECRYFIPSSEVPDGL